MNNRIIIAGGSGFLGQALAPLLLARGYEVAILGRGKSRRAGEIQHLQWDGTTLGDWAHTLDAAPAVVNLTGKNINCRHTPANRREITRSRVDSVRVLGAAIAACATPPQVFVQASGVGFYGNSGALFRDESSPVGNDFTAEVCREWEAAFDALQLPATRKVTLRIGAVLARHGGALQLLDRLTRAFLGGAVGSGQQWISWIHLADMLQMVLTAIEQPELTGPFNATAPEPVTNSEFMRELRDVLHRPWSPPVPAPFARAGAWLMGSAGDLALLSYRCRPRRFVEHGFEFQFPTLQQALRHLYDTKH